MKSFRIIQKKPFEMEDYQIIKQFTNMFFIAYKSIRTEASTKSYTRAFKRKNHTHVRKTQYKIIYTYHYSVHHILKYKSIEFNEIEEKNDIVNNQIEWNRREQSVERYV